MASRHSLRARQYYGNPAAYDSNYNSWWYSPTAYIVKWVITILILAAIFSYFGLGYMHAHRRMKRGLQPLRYHRVRRTVHNRDVLANDTGSSSSRGVNLNITSHNSTRGINSRAMLCRSRPTLRHHLATTSTTMCRRMSRLKARPR